LAATSSFPLEAFLTEQQHRVESILESRLAELASAVPPRLLEAMRYSLLGGGKRLRPILCLAFADASSRGRSGESEIANDAACAVEMIHTYSLIHDDLPSMDDDDLRRGRPTSHKMFGEALAILAGDALLTEAFGMVARGREAQRVRLGLELAQAAGAAGMIAGQVLDIAEDRPAEEAYLFRLHRLKTGALIRAACRMGVIAAGSNDDSLAAADAYGQAVGLAFQIADDILDVTGDSARMGKPTGADAAADRFTFPAVVGLAKSRALADEQIRHAVDAVAKLEPKPGPLHALAQYTLERTE
jgi:geranylgeranyl diphosphate synthase, type II